jgi:hypothetical protein
VSPQLECGPVTRNGIGQGGARPVHLDSKMGPQRAYLRVETVTGALKCISAKVNASALVTNREARSNWSPPTQTATGNGLYRRMAWLGSSGTESRPGTNRSPLT